MSKRNLLNLGLFVFIIVLVATVIYEPGKDVAAKPPTLTKLKSGNIKHINIIRHNANSAEQKLEFKKTSSGWIMLKPYTVSANTFRINSILELLSTVSFSQNSLENLEQETFGLNKPVVTITFNEKTSLIFGHNKSLKNHRYIKIGSELHLTADTFYYQLAAKSESYIDHKLFSEKNKITKLKLPSLKLVQTDAKWKVTPAAEDFSADSINQLISEWQLSQAYDVNKVKPRPNKIPDIIIELDDRKKIHFLIERNKNSFNLLNIDSGVRYILSSDREEKLLKLSNISDDN